MGLAVAVGLTQRGVALGHKPRATAADNRYFFTLFREQMGNAGREFRGLTPDIRLAGDLTIGEELARNQAGGCAHDRTLGLLTP